MSKFFKIAIAGHAASGKSTSAKKIADILHFDFINSGNIYRALSFVFLTGFDKKSFNGHLTPEMEEFLRNIKFEIIKNKYYWNDQECKLRVDEVNNFVA